MVTNTSSTAQHGMNHAELQSGSSQYVVCNMYSQDSSTELKLESPLPKRAIAWSAITLVVVLLYLIRVAIKDIPPQDHVALAIILCILLLQVWNNLEQTTLKISLPYDPCWVRYHHRGTRQEKSIPVSQIHSATLEYSPATQLQAPSGARIVLITSLGIIPVTEKFENDGAYVNKRCLEINEFLKSQQRFLQA